MKKSEESEADLQKAVMALLKLSGLVHWRQPMGGVMRAGGAFVSKNPMKGFPDIAGITPHGKLWGMELKRAGGKPTEEQLQWKNTFLANNAYWCLVDSIDKAQAEIQAIKRLT